MPYISVIVPVYNTGKALYNCLDSIVKQKFTDLEIIIVDDGSTDISPSIYENFMKTDIRIRVFKQKNNGVSFSRNLGIEKARGKYILFIDSDDWIPENYCQEVVNAQRMFGENTLIITGMIRIENGIKHIQNLENKTISSVKKSDILKLHDKNLLNCPTNKLYNTKVIKEKNIIFDINISIAEDLLFNLNYLDSTVDTNIVILNEIFYNYIKSNSNSLSQCYHNKFNDIHDNIYRYFFQLCIKWKVEEKDFNIWYKTRWWLMKKNLENTMLNGNLSLLEKVKYNNIFIQSAEFKQIMKKNRNSLSISENLLFIVGRYELCLLMYKIFDICNCVSKNKNVDNNWRNK